MFHYTLITDSDTFGAVEGSPTEARFHNLCSLNAELSPQASCTQDGRSRVSNSAQSFQSSIGEQVTTCITLLSELPYSYFLRTLHHPAMWNPDESVQLSMY